MSKFGITVHPSFVAKRSPSPRREDFRTPRRFASVDANRPETSVGKPRFAAGPLAAALIALAAAAGALASILIHALP